MKLITRFLILIALGAGLLAIETNEDSTLAMAPQGNGACYSYESSMDTCASGCTDVPVNQYSNGDGLKELVPVWVVCDPASGNIPECANYMDRAFDNVNCCDQDNDGYQRTICLGGTDCNDTPGVGYAINPGAYEGGMYYGGGDIDCSLCADGIDNNCNNATDLNDANCGVCNPSPIVIDTAGNGFNLTSAANGVMFDISATGHPLQIAWTQGDDAWLVLDRDGNGAIDNGRELFGNFTRQPSSNNRNGFLALAEFDKVENGGNGDGRIGPRDAIFSSLRLWQDTNHNGVSELTELHPPLSLDVVSIDLGYRESRRVDRYGNRFRYRAKVYDRRDASVGRWAWDVFLVTAP